MNDVSDPDRLLVSNLKPSEMPPSDHELHFLFKLKNQSQATAGSRLGGSKEIFNIRWN
jgi:hypothetical protein